MKNKTVLLIFIIFSNFISFGQSHLKEFPVEKILDEIQLGLVEIQTQLNDNNLPPLHSVSLTLETYYKKSTGGRLRLLIFSLGKRWEKETSQQLKLTLKPPKPKSKLTAKRVNLSRGIVDLVVGAAKGIQKAKENKEYPMETVSLEAEIRFAIITVSGAGLEYEIVPVSAALSGKRDLKKTAIHVIKVTYGKPQ